MVLHSLEQFSFYMLQIFRSIIHTLTRNVYKTTGNASTWNCTDKNPTKTKIINFTSVFWDPKITIYIEPSSQHSRYCFYIVGAIASESRSILLDSVILRVFFWW